MCYKRENTGGIKHGAASARPVKPGLPLILGSAGNKEGGELRGVCWFLWVPHCCFINLVNISTGAAYQRGSSRSLCWRSDPHTAAHTHIRWRFSRHRSPSLRSELGERKAWRSLTPPAEHMYSLLCPEETNNNTNPVNPLHLWPLLANPHRFITYTVQQ